jgi:hypothetical protein
MSNQPTVSDIFRRALEIKQANQGISNKEIQKQIINEYRGKPFPSATKLTIPEHDNVTPEEDWTAGLPLVLRGIQNEDWKDVALGIALSVEQIENYPKESMREDAPEKEWHDRNRGIADQEKKNLDKWLPEDLMNMAQRATKK